MDLSITPDGAVKVPEEKLSSTNKSAAVNWRRTPKECGSGYAALVDVFHQLHCLVSTVQSAPLSQMISLTIGLTALPEPHQTIYMALPLRQLHCITP